MTPGADKQDRGEGNWPKEPFPSTGWDDYQQDWYESDWTGDQWHESGFAVNQQRPQAADGSTMSWPYQTSLVCERVGLPAIEGPYCLWSFPNTAEGINLMANPLYVLLDIGCAKSMVSRRAVEIFRQLCGKAGTATELLPSYA